MYLEYVECRNKYIASQKKFEKILNEKEELFTRTQAKAIRYDLDKSGSGTSTNDVFDRYLIEKERKRIDQRLKEAESLLSKRARLLEIKERELRASKGKADRVYCLRMLDKRKVSDIAVIIGYSEPHVYRLIQEIEKMIRNDN